MCAEAAGGGVRAVDETACCGCVAVNATLRHLPMLDLAEYVQNMHDNFRFTVFNAVYLATICSTSKDLRLGGAFNCNAEQTLNCDTVA
jgi:hypothetical protein